VLRGRHASIFGTFIAPQWNSKHANKIDSMQHESLQTQDNIPVKPGNANLPAAAGGLHNAIQEDGVPRR
jgi:hypothetical protein